LLALVRLQEGRRSYEVDETTIAIPNTQNVKPLLLVTDIYA